MAKRDQGLSQQYGVVCANGARLPRRSRNAVQGYSKAEASVFVERRVIKGSQNFETSLYNAKTIMLRTNTNPIWYPTSCTRSGKGLPINASKQ